MALARDNYRVARSVYSAATCGLVLGLFSILLALYSARRPHLAQALHSGIFYVTAPVQRVITGIGGGVSGFFSGYIFLIGVKEQNGELQGQIERLQARNAELEELAAENDRLRRLVSMSEVLQTPTVAARVIGYETTNWRRTLSVSAGSRDGVTVGSAVLGSRGVVGMITSVSTFAAQVQLLTDPASSVDGIGHTGRARGVIDGEGGQFLRWRFVSTSEDIKEGELVVTTGMDGVFPKGITIGVVREVEGLSEGTLEQEASSSRLFQSIVVTPVETLGHLEEVLIVLPTVSKEMDATASNPSSLLEGKQQKGTGKSGLGVTSQAGNR